MDIKNLIVIFIIFGYSPWISAQYKVNAIEIGKNISALANAKDGQLNYGTTDGECGMYDGLVPQSESILPRINKFIYTKDKYWICTKKGLYNSDDGKLTNISGSHLDVLDYEYKDDLIIARQGVYTKEGSVYVLSEKDRMSRFSSIDKAKVIYASEGTYILLDDILWHKKRWWVQVTDSVIDVSVQKKSIIIAKSDGLYDTRNTALHYLSIDSTARLLGTNKNKLFLTNNNFISEVKKDRVRNIYSLNTNEIVTLHEDKWHNIWVSRGDFLYKIVSETSDQKIQLAITSINDSENVNSIKIKDDSNILKVKYKGVQLTSPQLIKYQSILEGHSDWSKSTNDKEIVYSDIQPGSYVYRLRATVDGVNFTYSEKIHVAVSSNSMMWVWGALFIGALGILITAYIGNKRMDSFKSKVERERKQLVNQNKLLALEQKALQLQMNPHFIFNALNSIKGQMALGDTKAARQSITKFAHLMRSTLDMSRQDAVSMSDEISYLEKYLSLEQWVNQNAFSFSMDIGDEVDRDIKIPTMLIQPFVENAIKHAFPDTIDKGNIAIKIEKVGSNIVIYIQDDGIGLQASESRTGHKSVAMSVVKERLDIKYPKYKNDLVVVNSPTSKGNGTEVVVVIPNAAI